MNRSRHRAADPGRGSHGGVRCWPGSRCVSLVDVGPVADGQPARMSVVYNPPLMVLAWLLGTTAGVLIVLGVAGLRRGRQPLDAYTP